MKRANDQTPWGRAQQITTWADGIQFISTASHGGFYLSPTRYWELVDRKGTPKLFVGNSEQLGGYWFEEDCDARQVAEAFPEIMNGKPLFSG